MGEVVNWRAEDITNSVVESTEKDVTDFKGDGSRDYSQARDATVEAPKEAIRRACSMNPEINLQTMEDLQRSVAPQTGNSYSEGTSWRRSGDVS